MCLNALDLTLQTFATEEMLEHFCIDRIVFDEHDFDLGCLHVTATCCPAINSDQTTVALDVTCDCIVGSITYGTRQSANWFALQ
jgi:hypothetical protein